MGYGIPNSMVCRLYNNNDQKRTHTHTPLNNNMATYYIIQRTLIFIEPILTSIKSDVAMIHLLNFPFIIHNIPAHNIQVLPNLYIKQSHKTKCVYLENQSEIYVGMRQKQCPTFLKNKKTKLGYNPLSLIWSLSF